MSDLEADHIPIEPIILGEMFEKSLYISMNWLLFAIFTKVL